MRRIGFAWLALAVAAVIAGCGSQGGSGGGPFGLGGGPTLRETPLPGLQAELHVNGQKQGRVDRDLVARVNATLRFEKVGPEPVWFKASMIRVESPRHGLLAGYGTPVLLVPARPESLPVGTWSRTIDLDFDGTRFTPSELARLRVRMWGLAHRPLDVATSADTVW